jgi:hypothetical protein
MLVAMIGSWVCPTPKDWKCPPSIVNFISPIASLPITSGATATAARERRMNGLCYITFGSMTKLIIRTLSSSLSLSYDEVVRFLRSLLSRAISDVGMRGIVHGLTLTSSTNRLPLTLTHASTITRATPTTPTALPSSPRSATTTTTTTHDEETHMLWLCEDEYVNHDWLYGQCELIIHHGGAGTVTSSIRAACTQVICPFAFDQHWWAETISHLNIGISCNSLWPTLMVASPSSLERGAHQLSDAIKRSREGFVHEMTLKYSMLIQNEHIHKDTIDVVDLLLQSS